MLPSATKEGASDDFIGGGGGHIDMTSASLTCLPLWVKVIQKMREETSSGGLLANDCLVHYSVSSLPFGGVGKRTRNSRPVITHATFGPFRHLAHGSHLGILSRTPPTHTASAFPARVSGLETSEPGPSNFQTRRVPF